MRTAATPAATTTTATTATATMMRVFTPAALLRAVAAVSARYDVAMEPPR